MIKPVFRYSASERMVRLLRLTWDRGNVGDGRGYSNKLSVGLQKSLFYFDKQVCGCWRMTLLGLHLSRQKSFGGHFT